MSRARLFFLTTRDQRCTSASLVAPVQRLLIFTLALGVYGCATTPPSPDALKVDDFDIKGEKHLKESELKKKVVTEDWYESNTWQADLRRILRVYEANGYYQARIIEEVVTDSKPQHVKLLVRLREGEPARIRTLALVGLEALPAESQTEVLAELPLNIGDIFLEDSWERTKKVLGQRLREEGFAEAIVTGEAVVDAEAAQVDLTVSMTPGIRYRFGKTFVATDSKAVVPPKLIAQIAAPDLPPGDYFSESAMADAQTRVFQMGVFAGVRVNRGAPDRAEGTIPVVIDVREAAFHSQRVGVGLGGDLIRQEVRLIGEYVNRNLGFSRLFSKDSRLDRLTLKAKLGWAFLPNVVEVIRGSSLAKMGPVWRLYTEYEIPRLFEIRSLTFQNSLEISRALDNTYNYDAANVKTGIIWQPRVDLKIFPSLNFNAYFLRAEVEFGETAPLAALGCPSAPNVCWLSFIDLVTEFDRRDNRLEPKAGYYFAIDVATGLSSADQLRPFLKVTPEARGYVSFGAHKQYTLAGRVKVGTLLAPEDNEPKDPTKPQLPNTPIVIRYFSGGSDMRGFQQRRLAPQLAVLTKDLDPRCAGLPNCDFDATTLPIGGAGLFEASAEFRWTFAENWVLALFNDWGMVTTKPLGQGQNLGASLYTALGFGVRYRTPLGPIRVDLAFRLPSVGGPQEVTPPLNSNGLPKLNSNGMPYEFRSQPGCFFGLRPGVNLNDPYTRGATAASFAGSPDNLCGAHLSIGEAF